MSRRKPDAIIPTKAYEDDAGFDLYSVEEIKLYFGIPMKVKTGIAMEIPRGYSGFIWDRSGLGSKGIKVFGGVIDSQYRGEVIVCLNRLWDSGLPIMATSSVLPKGSKIAQLCIFKTPEFKIEEVEELSSSERGNKGFGSSG
jgi:dUTP pyrophosphatase